MFFERRIIIGKSYIIFFLFTLGKWEVFKGGFLGNLRDKRGNICRKRKRIKMFIYRVESLDIGCLVSFSCLVFLCGRMDFRGF